MYYNKSNAFTDSNKNTEKGFSVKSKTLLLSTTAFMVGAMLVPANAVADNSWDYDTVLGGTVSKDVSVDDITDITVDGGNGFVEGNADIAAGHTVNVDGINGARTFAYRDNRADITSTLSGNLNSNIQIVIIDKDGLFFTDSANIDVQGLIATSADIAVDDIMNLEANGGTLVFDNVGDGGAIIVRGNVTVAEAGLAAFVSPFITNHGVINAKLGNVVMAAGETVTLDLYGDGLLELAVDGELEDALIENHNEIKARGGYVQVSASAAKGTVDNVVNNTGLITVASATVDGGKIILSGGDKGTVKNSGEIVTSTGGEIAVSGERFVQDSLPVVVDAEAFQLDEIIPIPAVKPRIVGAGGDITIETSGNVGILDGRVEAKGGDITINNGGIFKSLNVNTLRTEGEGTITLNQNAGSIETMSIGSIQNAIDAINNTGTGQNTINVGAGTYNESLVVDHDNVTLNGANAGIHGTGERSDESVIQPNSPGVLVVADNTLIDGFAFVGTGSDAGVEVDGADNVTVSNNTMTGFEYGVLADTANNLDVTGNFVDGADVHGMFIENSNDVTIGANVVDASDLDGIRVEGGKRAVITYNEINNSGDDGIDVNDNDYVIIDSNFIDTTQLNVVSTDGNAIEVSRSKKARVSYNQTSNTGADGVDIKSSHDANVYENIVTDSGDDGIDVDRVERINVFSNTITNTGGEGLEITSAEKGNFYNNIIINAGDDGIDVKLSDDITIQTNTIDVTGSDGVQLVDSERALIDDNGITNTGENGVFIESALDATISNNFIFTTGTNGIYVSGSNNADVIGNDINFAGEHGIKVNPSDDVEIIGNFIFSSFFDGIRVNDGKRAIIDGNFVDLSGDDGIDVDNNDDVIVKNNIIDTTQLHPDATDGNAIEVSRSDRADISFNTTSNTGADGVDVKSSRDVKVYENIVSDAGDDGIDVDNVIDIEVYKNTVTNTGGEGLEITSAEKGNFHNNIITNAGDDGIDVKLSDDIIIKSNKIDVTGSDGIQLVDSERALIKKNRIRDTGENGIFIENALDATISWNNVKDTGTNGIYVSGSNNADVKFNAVNNAGEHGIKVNPSDDVEITGNFVFKSFFDGIRVDDGKRAVISYNIVKKSGDDGIDVNDNDDVVIKKNVISITGQHPDATDGNAIEVRNSDRAQIFENHASFTQADGVDVKSSRDVKVYDNTVRFAGDDGIDVDNTKNIEVYGNDVKFAGGEGIEITNADEGNFHHNTLKKVGDDGIDVKDSDDIIIQSNTIDVVGSDGVQIVDSERALVDDNGITNSGENGVYTLNAPDATISGNVIDVTGTNGVYVSNGSGTTIIGNTISNSGENNIKVNPSDFINIHNNDLSYAGEDGINVRGGTGHDIRGNYIFHALNDGIDVRDFGHAWIAYNEIEFTGDDGIDVREGNFVSIYDNYINLSGYLPNRLLRFGPFSRNIEVGEDANGIYVSNVGGGDLPSSDTDDVGFGSSFYGTSVEIYNNEVSNSEDDGIQIDNYEEKPRLTTAKIEGGVSGGYSAYIGHNIVGHVGDDGIDVDGNDVTYVKGNAVTLAEDKGITIDGGRYAGVFDNRVLLTGNDGIQVENVYGGLDAMLLGDIDYGYGWSVNVSGNEVALTGDDGIEVRNSGPTKVAHNGVFIAGLGEDLGDVIGIVNDFANGTFTFAPPFLAPQIQGIEGDFKGFGWEWGNGHGINVHGISGAQFSPNGWAADIRGNTVQYTGGHGILVENNDRTRINRNRVRYAGIDYTFFHGTDGMLEMLDSGAFASDERRDLWMSSDESLVSVMEGYFGTVEEEPDEGSEEEYISILDVGFDSHDGIHAENIRGNVFLTGALRDSEGQKEIVEGGYEYDYDLKIVGNRINTTGDDGIEVDGAGRTLIGWNRIRNAGYGDDVPYSGDRTGADGIHVRNVFNNILTTPTFAGIDGSGYYGYAVNIIGNKINTTGDDGIAVVNSSSAYIANNRIRNAGYHGSLESEVSSFEGDRRRGTRFGSDGIHVRNVYGEEFGSVGSLGVDYAVVIQGNKINTTGDDGIEVRNAGRTLIDNNRIRNAGFGGGRDYEGGDRYGADGIFVTNVHANEFYQGPVDFAGGPSNPEYLGYSVIITNNKVNYTGDDGIEVQKSGSTLIDNNRVKNTGDDGIVVRGHKFFGPKVDVLQSEAIYEGEGKGSSKVVITNNIVKNAGGNGIHAKNINDLVVSDNEVSDSFRHGAYIAGGHNGYVEFQGNTFTNNGQFSESAQARFESGDIDMSDLTRPNIFINTTGVPATAMQFDDVYGSFPEEDEIESVAFKKYSGGNGLRIVGETLGSTIFEGYQPEGSFYVRFEDGSILDPVTGDPIIIDGTDASFDGVVPGTFPGEILPLSTLQFIEDRLYDADDETVNGRGQIFVGSPPEEGIENIQDFFDNFDNQNGVSNQASLIINGLPSIGGGTGNLNNIAPAAGGDGSEFANINPAAGGSDESQEVTCMADAVNSLETGAVTYNFGGTFEDGIASEAGCTSRNI